MHHEEENDFKNFYLFLGWQEVLKLVLINEIEIRAACECVCMFYSVFLGKLKKPLQKVVFDEVGKITTKFKKIYNLDEMNL